MDILALGRLDTGTHDFLLLLDAVLAETSALGQPLASAAAQVEDQLLALLRCGIGVRVDRMPVSTLCSVTGWG